MKIYQTGDIYIVEINANCEGQITKYPATFRDGQLKLSGPRGETALAYIDATGHILLDGSEYERNTRVLAQRGFSYLSQSREANDSPLVASAPIARMRGTYESEETTGVQLEVTSDTMVIKAGPETATIDYKVVSVTAANVTVEIDVKNQGTFNLVIGVREDSLVIERNGVGFLGQGGTWTRR